MTSPIEGLGSSGSATTQVITSIDTTWVPTPLNLTGHGAEIQGYPTSGNLGFATDDTTFRVITATGQFKFTDNTIRFPKGQTLSGEQLGDVCTVLATIDLETAVQGDIYYWNQGKFTPLATGTSSQFLSGGTSPSYRTLLSSDLPIATRTSVGSVKIGRSLLIDSAGLLRVSYIDADQINSVAPSTIAGILPTSKGGTGLDTSTAGNGKLLIGTGTGLALANLTAGSSMSITNTSGGITIDFVGSGGGGGFTSPLTTKGDLWTYSTVNTRLGVGTNSYVLVADSTQSTGLVWTTRMNWQGVWSNITTYNVNDVVSYLGSSYVAVQVNTGVQPNSGPDTLHESNWWGNTGPDSSSNNGFNTAIEEGERFTCDVAGFVMALRFYKIGGDPSSTHTLHLWDVSGGTLLATGTTSGETSSGWQTATLTTPVAMSVGQTFLASVQEGTFGYSGSAPSGSGQVHPTGAKGYLNATGGQYPVATWDFPGNNGIAVDAVFAPSGGAPAQWNVINLNPMTTPGDLIYGGISGVPTRLPGGTTSQVLVGGSVPAFGNVPAAALTSVPAGSLTGLVALARGGTNVDNSSVVGNKVWASPDGSTGPASYRSLVAADIPTINFSSLPIATNTTVGAVKIGRSLLIDSTGLLRVSSVDANQINSVAPSVIAPGISTTQITLGTLSTARGGTGLNTSTAANGQLLIGTGSGLALSNITAGSNITVTNSSGGISISSTTSSSYFITVLSNTPTAYYRLGDSVGSSSALDSSVNGNTGTIGSTVTFGQPSALASDTNTSASFSSGGSVAFPSSFSTHTPGDGRVQSCTHELWFKTSASGSDSGILVAVGTNVYAGSFSGFQALYLSVNLNSSGHIYYNWYGTPFTAGPYNDGVWHHLVVTIDTNVTYYVDGINIGSNNTDAQGTQITYWWLYGCGTLLTNSIQHPFQGTIDEIAFYNGVILSQSTITAHYNAGRGNIDTSKLVGTISASNLPVATRSTIGAVKIGRSLLVDSTGLLRVSSIDADQINSVAPSVIAPGIVAVQISSVNPSSLTGSGTIPIPGIPIATNSLLGGVIIGSGINVDGFGVISTINNGTVTSVDILPPFEIEVANNPITTSGTINLTWTNEPANTVFAGIDGSSGTPEFRLLVPADIPNLDISKITTGATSSTASAGVGTLPATPEKFLNVNIGGTDYRIPLYNT